MNTAWRQYLSVNTLFSLDESLDYQEKVRRDRKLAIELESACLESKRRNKHWQTVLWLEANLSRLNKKSQNVIDSYLSALTIAHWLAIIIAIVVGISVAGGLFYYNGNEPINVVNFLWIAVFLQWFFIVFLLLSMLPEQIKKYIWGINHLTHLVSKCNVGKWLYHITSWLLEQKQSMVSNGASASIKNQSDEDVVAINLIAPSKKIVQWQVMVWSQWFALVFNLVLLITAMYLVAFSDLAFGWSSTLDIPPSTLQSITDFLSSPWQTLWPQAVPSADLIENSRYFRALAGSYGNQSGVDIMALGQWWSFILATVTVYGILPRFILLVFTRIALNRALLSATFSTASTTLLLQRMNTERIKTQALDTPEMGEGNAEFTVEGKDPSFVNFGNSSGAHAGIKISNIADKPVVYHWLDKVCPSANYWQMLSGEMGNKVISNGEVKDISEIGMQGILPVSESALVSKNQTLVLLVKSWEPPTLSFIDWLSFSSKQYDIKLLPYGVTMLNDETVLTYPSASDLSVWQNKLVSNALSQVEIVYMENALHD